MNKEMLDLLLEYIENRFELYENKVNGFDHSEYMSEKRCTTVYEEMLELCEELQ